MKKRVLFLTLSLLAPAAFIGVNNKTPIETLAADSGYKTTSLPSTIDLNPVSADDIRSYYASLEGKSLQGNDLLKALKPILKQGQQYHSYDSGNAIWQMYEITDRDWSMSPATSITNGNYDPATNIITGYKYGSMSDPKDNPYLHLLYRNHDEPAAKIKAWDHHGDNKGIDREHIWPKSRGFGKNGSTEVKVPGARGDIHPLLPGDSYVNSTTHSNNAYGFVDMSKITDNAGENYKIDGKTVVKGNYRGTSLTYGTKLGSAPVFEPQDCDKGDIARACFYMVARYNNLAGDDNTIDAGNPNLFLEDTVDNDTIYSTPTKAVSIGILRDLLAWHKLDPVDDYEIQRNDIIYRNYAKNRNPFVDFPSWVDAIWGTVELNQDNRTIKERNEKPQGVASPSTDTLSGSESSAPIISIELKNAGTTYFVQQDMVFDGKIIGTDQDGYKRDVTSKCKFSGYDFSAVGNTTITITYSETVKTTLDVKVAQPASLIVEPVTTTITKGQKYVFEGKVFGVLEETQHEVTNQCSFSEIDTSKEGERTLTVTHNPSQLKATIGIVVQENLAPFGLSWPLFFALVIGGGALLIIIFAGVIFSNKKAKKAAAKSAKKALKNAAKSKRGK